MRAGYADITQQAFERTTDTTLGAAVRHAVKLARRDAGLTDEGIPYYVRICAIEGVPPFVQAMEGVRHDGD